MGRRNILVLTLGLDKTPAMQQLGYGIRRVGGHTLHLLNKPNATCS